MRARRMEMELIEGLEVIKLPLCGGGQKNFTFLKFFIALLLFFDIMYLVLNVKG